MYMKNPTVSSGVEEFQIVGSIVTSIFGRSLSMKNLSVKPEYLVFRCQCIYVQVKRSALGVCSFGEHSIIMRHFRCGSFASLLTCIVHVRSAAHKSRISN